MQLSVFVDLLSSEPSVVLQPIGSEAEPIVLGKEAPRSLVPLFDQFFGQLILLTSFEKQAPPSRRSDGRIHVFVPLRIPSPRLVAFWIGRLASTWKDEPKVTELLSVVPAEEKKVLKGSLSQVLQGLFCRAYSQRADLYLGTSAALQRIQSLDDDDDCPFSKERMVDVLMRLRVTRQEASGQVPCLDELVPDLLVADTEEREELAKELKAKRQQLEEAQAEFRLEEERITAAQTELQQRVKRYQSWLRNS